MGRLVFGASVVGSLFAAACSGTEFSAGGGGGSGSEAGETSGGTHTMSGDSGAAGADSAGRGGDASSGAGGMASGGAGAAPGAGTGGSVSLGGASGGAPPVNECPCAAPTPTCQAGKCVSRGARMIKAGSSYVDSTEVTVESYQLFLAAKGDDTAGQADECAWNDSYAPAVKLAAPKQPVTHVDYCDAVAYCSWADKRLCGKIGGGALAFADLASPTKSQWFAACGGPKGQPYPYGTQPIPEACNSDGMSVEPVASHPECQGFADGLFDMVGNVAEWVDACDASSGAADGCETIGGSYLDSGTCSLSSLKHRDEQLPNVGFRCCSK